MALKSHSHRRASRLRHLYWWSLRTLRYAADDVAFRRIYRKFHAFTMINRRVYLDNLHLAAQIRELPGSVVECGTWRGGMIAGLADVLGAKRRYFLFDSFEGLPPAGIHDGDGEKQLETLPPGPWTGHGRLVASETDAQQAMALSAATDYDVVKGWFHETLPTRQPDPIALLRLDGDWYESTKCALDHYGDRVVPGGLIIVDDYYTWEGCTQAVNEFAAPRKWQIRQFGWAGICFMRMC